MNAKTGLARLDAIVLLACIVFLSANISVIMAGWKGNANRQVCMSNLHELTAAWDLFSEDNTGKIPSANVWHSRTFRKPPGPQGAWFEWPHIQPPCDFRLVPNDPVKEDWTHSIADGLLWEYIKDYRIYRCLNGDKDQYVTYTMSLSMNTYPNAGGTAQKPSFTIISKNQITNPADKFVFLDTGFVKMGAFFVVYSGPNMGKWYDLPPVQHENGTTFSFADGHVIYKKWTDQHTLTTVYKNYDWGNYPIDYGDSDLRWMVKATWGDVPYNYAK